MFKEALQYLHHQFNRDHYHMVLDEPAEITFFNKLTGDKQVVQKDRQPLDVTAFDIDSFCTMIEQAEDADASSSAIFVSPEKVVCILDFNAHRIDRITLPLERSTIYAFLEKHHITGKPKEVINHLRHNILSVAYDCFPEDLIARLSILKFETHSEESHNVQPNDEGVSKSLKSKVTGEHAIPDSATVSFIMYPDFEDQLGESNSTHVSVKLAIDADPAAGTVSIRTFPGELRSAAILAMKNITNALGDRLEGFGNRIYCGKP